MTIISLVSDQPMPNLLFIRQMPVADRYVFLTTERMEREGKTDNLVRVCGIPPGKVDYLYSDHEHLPEILAAWEELEEEPDDEYHINLTGGTKMMALATFGFFTQSVPASRVHVYYLPLNAGLIRQTYPESLDQALEETVGVAEYLEVHGVKLISHEAWESWAEEATRVFRHISGQQPDQDIQNRLLESRTSPAELGLRSLSTEERNFYSGKWLEIWLAAQVRDLLQIDASQILWDVKLNRSGTEINQTNEYDVIFVRDNRLYLAECKYFTGKGERRINKISKELFKMGAANNLMGLNARPFFAIVGDLDTRPEDLNEQCRILRMRPPAFMRTLKNPTSLRQFLTSL